MPAPSFQSWLASLLGQNEYSAKLLLKDRTALHFLVAWSLFEAKCAAGRFGAKKLLKSDLYPKFTSKELALIAESSEALHKRYQNKNRLEELAPASDRVPEVYSRIESCINLPAKDLSEQDHLFFCAFVASRVRNNMFHGAKGIDDWLRDKPLIENATNILMLFISAAERQQPSLIAEDA